MSQIYFGLGMHRTYGLRSIKLDDFRSVSSLVKFGNNGILQAAHVGKLITDEVVLTGVLMVPG